MPLHDQLERLSAFETAPYPVISLYLNTQPNERGRDQYQAFVRKEFKARAQTYAPNSPERASLDRDFERIGRYLETELQPSANGVAIFACDAGELFEAVQLDAPLDDHWLYIGDRPHLYPLARVASQFPVYAALLADTTSARIVVVVQGRVADSVSIEGVKTRRQSQGGWSQARYQRHLENYHLQHVKDVIEALDRVVAREGIEQILVAGDPVVIPLLREQMPKHLAEKIVERISVDANAGDDEVIEASLEAMKKLNERTDRERVEAAVGAYRAGGLGVVGPDETLLALTNGQVDELLIAASVAQLEGLREGSRAAQMALANDAGVANPAVDEVAAGEPAARDIGTVRLADELVTKAQQTGARVTFIEDGTLLKPYGGVAALHPYPIECSGSRAPPRSRMRSCR
jgi:peptide chain release factor subunit 1